MFTSRQTEAILVSTTQQKQLDSCRERVLLLAGAPVEGCRFALVTGDLHAYSASRILGRDDDLPTKVLLGSAGWRAMSVVVSLTSASKRQLRLYIAGETPATFRARAYCKALLGAAIGVEIEEIDVLTEPAAAEAAGILATPILSDDALAPPRRIVGDLGDIARVLQFLGIERFTA